MSGACFHCGAALEGPPGHELVIDGERRAFCSLACLDIARHIRDEGLTRFYRFREAPAASADATPGTDAPRNWQSYDRPVLQQEFVAAQRDGSREAHMLVSGVRCAACSWLIERAMSRVPGVRALAVDPLTTRMRLRWDPTIVPLSELLARIAALGYEPFPCTDDDVDRAARLERRRALPRLIVAGFGMSEVMGYATAMYLGAFQGMDPSIEQFFRLVSMLVATPVVFYAGAPFFAGAWRGLRSRRPGMDLPVAIAIAAAYAASVWNTLRGGGEVYFDSAVMFVFFLSSARFLEMSGRHRAISLTGALARHLPRVATRLTGALAEPVGVAELVPGDLVLVQPGQTVPADGMLEGDAARVDESLLTGESRPVHKQAGDTVLAGSINLLAAAKVRVREVGANTTLAQIGRLVSTAGGQRPRLVQVTDRVAMWFVSAVLLLSGTVGALWWWFAPERAFEVVLAILVVTCPCALAIATPAAFTVGMSTLARRGVLLRNAGAIEALSRLTDLVFDKTGTLTEYSAGLQRIEPFGGRSETEVLALAAALEAHSTHPLARAFPKPAIAAVVTGVRAVPGQGFEGIVNGHRLRIGTYAFALGGAAAAQSAQASAEAAVTVVYLADDSGLLARFEIAEQLRAGAAEALGALRERGIALSIASGDQPGPVRAVASRLGVATWHAALQPQDKLQLVRRLQAQGRIVGMVGDGINDSPVLAGADVSIAPGSGASLAQHSADCVLMGTGPGVLPDALRLAQRTMRIVRQNLWWAAGYNAVSVPLAAAGVLAPWLAALGMSLSSLLVTFNALRLGHDPSRPAQPRARSSLRAGEAAT